MPETYLHGVEVVEVDDGPRSIRTVRSSVIGVVGTAPDSQAEVKAKLTTGLAVSNNALVWTSKLTGALGNSVSVTIADPKANNSALAVSVSGTDITVRAATGANGAITTTAAQLIAAITANTEASRLVTVENATGSAGTGAIAAGRRAVLADGVDEAFPLNTPVLVAGDTTLVAQLGKNGTLPKAFDGIFDQAGAVVIVVRVGQGQTDAETMTNVIGGIDVATGKYTGVHALLGSVSVTGFTPKILIAPGFTHQRENNLANPVVAEMQGVAERLRAVIVKDGPNTTDADAIKDRGDWGSARIFLVDPFVLVRNDLGEVEARPASDRVAGLVAKMDNDKGFWHSPSNQIINGIIGTARAIDFVLGDANSRANLLNEQDVATIIREDGFRLWGNRTCSSDPKWSFLSVRRTADMINESILKAHMWAVDRNITKTYFEDVAQGVNDYIAGLVIQGALLGGKCYPTPGLNSIANVMQGKAFWDFDFTPPFPAEHLTFRSKLVGDYIEEIL